MKIQAIYPSARRAMLSLLAVMSLAMVFTSQARAEAQDAAMEMHQKQDIVDTAISAGQFNTLVTALKEADLVETLRGPGPFTVFAPTDEAFAKIPKDQLQALLKDKEALKRVLLYHVVPGRYTATDVAAMETAPTVEGSDLSVKADRKGVSIDQAKVVSADIEASNGVIHVIDTVLMPPQ